MKKKIIFFHPYSVLGGADLSISKLILCSPKNYDLEFLTLSKKPKINFYLKKKIKISKLNYSRLFFSIFEIRKKLKKEIKIYDQIIFISNQNFANIISLISLFKLKKIKKISFERNHLSELNYISSFSDFFKNKILKICIKFFYRYSDLIIGNSYELSKDLKDFIGRKVETLQNFYDFKKIIRESKHKLRKKIKFKKNIVLNVGRLEDQKNQILLIKAFRIILKKEQNINLLIVGNGSKKNILLDYIKCYNLSKNIQIISDAKNSLPYFKKSKIFVSTSRYEGFPNVIVEALALNLPVISTYYKSGITEILLNGRGGIILKDNTAKNIAKNIIFYMQNKKTIKQKTLVAKKNLKKFNFENGKYKFKKLINNL